MSKHSGFTLVELLIVITIIAILSVIGLVVYGNFLKNSRDSKRQSDLKFIQSALENYHADQLYYPASLGTTLISGTKIYMTRVPTDPKPSPYPNYLYTVSGTNYCLSAKLEGTNLPPSECTNPGYNYGVTRP